MYCQRAWWYQRRKIKPANQDELTNGADFHGSHWLQANALLPLRAIAWFLLLAALVLLAIFIGLRAAG